VTRFSPLYLVRQKFTSYRIEDIPAEVRRQLAAAAFHQRLKPGAAVAIGVGSRGIANIALIVRTAVAWWQAQGMKPFIFPAMGSHGAATAKGQAEVLAKYGIVESEMGCPVRSQLAVVNLGRSPEGIETFVDKLALHSDGILLCGRVKRHTDFAGRLESGLFKMMAIGLGKFAGARNYHTHAYKIGLEAVIRSVGRKVLSTGKILGGLAILEDGNHDTGMIEAVPVERMEQREEELLEIAKGWMPRVPLEAVDILIVNELGKDISGSGMDTKVINRSVHGAYNPWPDAPKVERVYLRGLSKLSYGNGVGFGMADMVHPRMLKAMKKTPTFVNSLTSNTLASIRTPASYATDRACLEALWPTVGKFDPREVGICWIRDTQDLSLMAMTSNYRAEIEANPNLEIVREARDLDFDARGDLAEWLDRPSAVPEV
jgi:hypothetical protein